MNRRHSPQRTLGKFLLVAASFVATSAMAGAPPAPSGPVRTDLTGQWVAVVTEDWRWRMVTPPKGDFASIPYNDAGRAAGATWDPDRDVATGAACKAYGAAGLLRQPTRVRISWLDANTLQLETDAGQQTRRIAIRDGLPDTAVAPSLQGSSVGQWAQPAPSSFGAFMPARPPQLPVAPLKVTTARLLPGYLRSNGAPYSDQAVLTEYFDRVDLPDGTSWLIVTTLVNDPQFLTTSYITSSQFRKEPEGGAWNPAPCRVGRPL